LKFFKLILFVLFIWLSNEQICYGQTNYCDKTDKELNKLYLKIAPFYSQDQDSLIYYSDLFTSRLTKHIKDNSPSIECSFSSLSQNIDNIITTSDGAFRIYSWDTWTGGTMTHYNNIFQFKSEEKVYTIDYNSEERNMGTNYTDVFSLKIKAEKYFLVIGRGNTSKKYSYEFINIYSITGNKLDDNNPIIKTINGLTNSINLEYDFFSVRNRIERPIRLIKYDNVKKTIYVPIILDSGKVTDKFIIYQLKGKYFEK